MLITLICIYLAALGCAYAAVHRFPGRRAYWLLYVAAALVLPHVFGGVFHLVYLRVAPESASGLSATVVLFGVVLGAVSYPLSHARMKRGGAG